MNLLSNFWERRYIIDSPTFSTAFIMYCLIFLRGKFSDKAHIGVFLHVWWFGLSRWLQIVFPSQWCFILITECRIRLNLFILFRIVIKVIGNLRTASLSWKVKRTINLNGRWTIDLLLLLVLKLLQTLNFMFYLLWRMSGLGVYLSQLSDLFKPFLVVVKVIFSLFSLQVIEYVINLIVNHIILHTRKMLSGWDMSEIASELVLACTTEVLLRYGYFKDMRTIVFKSIGFITFFFIF